MNSESSRKTEQRSRRGRIAVFVILVVLAALAVAVLAVYRSLVVKPELPPVETPPVVQTPPITTINPDTGEEEPVEDPVVILPEKIAGQRKSEDFYTILVVGTDTSSASTDTMMLVSYDVTNQKATVMAIPRDTLVSAFGTERFTRINSIYAAYGRGERGMNALTAEVSELLGFVPDYRVFISWELVGQMVDAIGGVEYNVPFHMEYDDPYQDLHIRVEKGLQTLNGDQAMQVVRWRKNNAGVEGGGDGSDLNRLKVQQGFLKAALKAVLQIQNVTKIDELAQLFSDHVESDLTLKNLLWFATQAISGGLQVDSVEFTTMPWLSANPYIYPDRDALLELVNGKLNPYVENVTIHQMDLIYFDAEGNLCSTGRASTEN